MKEVTVKLDLNTINFFNHEACKLSGDIDVISGRYVIDGKSLLGLYSLNLNNNLTVKINNINNSETENFIEAIKELRV